LRGRCDGAAQEHEEIYVALLGEGLDVWQPVRTKRLSMFLVLDQDYDREVEPGTTVRCRSETRNADPLLVAFEAGGST
jgi:hypothetical protein